MCIHVGAGFKDEYVDHDFIKCQNAECPKEEHCAYTYCGAPKNHLVHRDGTSDVGRVCKQCALMYSLIDL